MRAVLLEGGEKIVILVEVADDTCLAGIFSEGDSKRLLATLDFLLLFFSPPPALKRLFDLESPPILTVFAFSLPKF